MPKETTQAKMKRLFEAGDIKGWGRLMPQLEKEVAEERKNAPKKKCMPKTEEEIKKEERRLGLHTDKMYAYKKQYK